MLLLSVSNNTFILSFLILHFGFHHGVLIAHPL